MSDRDIVDLNARLQNVEAANVALSAIVTGVLGMARNAGMASQIDMLFDFLADTQIKLTVADPKNPLHPLVLKHVDNFRAGFGAATPKSEDR